MTDSIQTNNNKSDLPQAALGIAGGAATGFALRKGAAQLTKPYLKTAYKNIDKFTPQDQETFVKEADRMAKEAGIKEKGFAGINYIDTSKNNKITDIEEFLKEQLKDFDGSKASFKKLMEKIKNLDSPELNPTKKISTDKALGKFFGGVIKTVTNGSLEAKLKLIFMAVSSPFSKMADLLTGKFKSKADDVKLIKSLETGAFDPISNRIFTSKPASVLHEIGHAINKNASFLSKIPGELSLVSKVLLIPLAILTAIFTKKPQKTNEEQPKNKSPFKKVKDFVHNHIGLTIAGLFTPILVEEGLASSRAVKFVNASKVLSETAKKQHNKALQIAYGSYLIGTVILASIVKLSVVVKDKIMNTPLKKS